MLKIRYSLLPLFLTLILISVTQAQPPIQVVPFWQTAEEDVYSTGMVWRDMNGDGYIDVCFSNGNDIVRARNFIYLSRYGTLPANGSWFSNDIEYSGHCAVGDVDDNGFPDLAVSNFLGQGGFLTTNRAVLYSNPYGIPGMVPSWRSGDSMNSFSCAFGDPDGDGDLDLAVSTGEGYNAVRQRDRVYFNESGSLATLPGWQSGALTQAMDVTWGDVDNDGDLDLAFCYDDDATAVYYNQNGVLETSPSWQSSIVESGNTLIFGDVNNDGWLDLIVAYNFQLGGNGYYRVYFNDGAGMLNSSPGWESSDGGYGSAVSLYDYDNDGDDDLAAGRWWDEPRLYENIGGTFSGSPVWQAALSMVVEELAWVDIDGDGVEAFSETIYANGKKLFYAEKHPLFSLDSVLVDGAILPINQYCSDPISGWVSLATVPLDSLVLYYKYSSKNDLTVANWDTYNFAFANTRRPFVDFYADTAVGWAPLQVNFSDSSIGASSWEWRFGDGGTSDLQNPPHTYADGGAFDVTLENLLPDGPHNRTRKKMIIAFADTISFPSLTIAPGETVKIPVRLRNCHPMKRIVLPISYAGSIDLTFTAYDTVGCRSSYFDQVQLANYVPAEKKLAFILVPSLSGSKPELPAGDGPIINLYFQHSGGSGVGTLDSSTVQGKTLSFEAGYVTFLPYVKKGFLTDTPYAKGDANHDGHISILDVTYIIAFLFKSGPPVGLYEGDADSNGKINILDATFLLSFLYKGGPPPLG